MSSAVASTSAALGRPFVFDDEPEVCNLVSTPRKSISSAGPGVKRPFDKLRAGSRDSRRDAGATERFSVDDVRLAGITPASRLNIRPAPEMASSGIPALDALAGGLPRGCLPEICGPASSGRTTVLLAALAAATRRGEFCVVVDASDALDPHSVAAAGVELDRLLWVRCGAKAGVGPQTSDTKEKVSQTAFMFGRTESRQSEHRSEHRLEQVLRATDMLLESGGFGLIALDLCDLPLQAARRIPLTTWFRYRRAVEHTPTVLLAVEQHPIAGSCSSLLLQLRPPNNREAARSEHSEFSREAAACDSPARKCRVAMEMRNKSRRDGTIPYLDHVLQIPYPTHAQLLTGLEITVELIRSRLERKPTRSTSASFAGKTAWAG